MTEPITLAAEGYDELAIILRDAFLQASEGKGAERHANSKPFHEQPMQTISDLFDSDKGMAFQIVKKLREGLDMPEYERLERELLGVIVYTAGAILWHKRRHVAEIDAEIQAAALARPVDIYAQAAAHMAETSPQPRVVGMNPNIAAPYNTTAPVELPDMSDPANWLPGDLLTRARGTGTHLYTPGGTYELLSITAEHREGRPFEVQDDGGLNSSCVYRPDEVTEKFAWHSRPTK